MEIIIVSAVALMASALTLFSGFGLGTLLMPVVAIFFPIEIAIAITAMVHLANNLFKVVLLGRQADPAALIRFGLPAMACAFLGALVLSWLSGIAPIVGYKVFDQQMQVVPIKLIVGLLILIFVLLELSPKFSAIKFDRKYLPFGGAISGFFGGLSGHQGAFRSMFLLKTGLTKEKFVATGVVLAVMVDMSRMVIYGWDMSTQRQDIEWQLVLAASFSAFIGAFFGVRLLGKITIRAIQITVSAMLVIISLGLILGVL